MISIIICSRTSNIPVELRQNIAETTGCDYELVVIDNSENRYTIFAAYNEGIRRSKGDVLCFMHEDVLFRTAGWGNVINNHFKEDETMGLIGFAGTHFLPSTPMYWYSSPFVSQRNLNNDQGVVEEHFHEDWFGDRNIIEVVAVDGFCFFARKPLFDHIAFDEKTYQGFHLYDMDICMQVIQAGFKVGVCRDVMAEHCWSESKQFSKDGGDLFAYNMELFAQKWHDLLPIHKGLELPDEVYDRVNGLFQQTYKTQMVYKSKAYRLGKVLLHPLRWLRKH
jgi:GT2 family glycosyltransferase